MSYYKKEKYYICGETKKWVNNCDCEKCKKHDDDKGKKDNHKDDKRKEDRNEWIRDLLRCLVDRRVVFFTKDGTHTEGTVSEISRDFVTVVPTRFPFFEAVEVESNATGDGLENFLKYFIRLDDIVGFGEETLGDPAAGATEA